MKRRDFISKVVPTAAAAGLVLTGCQAHETAAPSMATRPRVQWRMVSSFPRGLDILFGGAEFFTKRVSALTDGAFTIRLYPAGEIVPANQVFDAVQQGTVQCGQSASYYYTGKHEALAFDTGVPFGLNTRQQQAWLTRAGGSELINEVLSAFNLFALPAGNTGAQMGGWFRRDIHSVADLNGLKMRIPGLGGEVMSRMNVTVQMLAGSDLYMALERGVIDAVEWVGPYDDEKLGFQKIIKNYYYPGWWEPGATLSHYFNQAAWDKLPSDYQEALRSACAETCVWMTAAYDVGNAQALDRLVAGGVQLKRFPPDMLITAERITHEIFQEKAAADPAYRKIYDHWRAFREQSRRWFSIADPAQTV